MTTLIEANVEEEFYRLIAFRVIARVESRHMQTEMKFATGLVPQLLVKFDDFQRV